MSAVLTPSVHQPVVTVLIRSLITELGNFPCPEAKDIKDLAYAIHGAQVRADVPELLWLNPTFEDMGDLMVKASFNASVEAEDPEDVAEVRSSQ